MEPVVVRLTGKLIPRVGMYSKRNIQKGEELTFMYGRPNAGGASAATAESKTGSIAKANAPPRARPCFCGAAACLGYLPCETVD